MEIPHPTSHENNMTGGQLPHPGRVSLSRPGTRVFRGNIEMNLDGETRVQGAHTLSKEEVGDLELSAAEAGREVLRVDSATDIGEIAALSDLINSGEAVCLISSASTGSKLLNAATAAQRAMEAGVQPHRLLFEDDIDDQSDIASNLRSILS